MEYGLVGEKLGHSFSRQIHEGFGVYRYDLLPMDEQAFDRFFGQRQFKGVNVTIPYKQRVMPFCSLIHPLAREIGAVNTVLNRAGILEGYNTDFEGLAHTLAQSGVRLEGRTLLVLGSGGAAKTALALGRHLGAAGVWAVSRHPQGEGQLAYGDLPGIGGETVVINATPVGMYPENGQSPLDLASLQKPVAVFDLIYNPLQTPLLAQAKAMGLPCANGLNMLVVQAAAACALFTGTRPPAEVVERVYRDLLCHMRNIVLIGMPGSGKSTMGRRLAQALGRSFVDMDTWVEQRAKKSIADIFADEGEEAFRRLESQAAAECGKRTGWVISTGGGVVKRPENMRALGQNGLAVYIDRPLEALGLGNGRPLSKSPQALACLYRERKGLYERYGELRVENSGNHDEGFAALCRALKREGFLL